MRIGREVRLLGIRPPEVSLSLSNYPEAGRSVCVSPNNTRTPSLGLHHVATVARRELEERGYDVGLSLMDMAIAAPTTLSDYGGSFCSKQVVPYGRGQVTKRLRGMPLSALPKAVGEADIVFLTSPFTSNAASVAQTALAVKALDPKVKVLVGGRDAQHRPEWYLTHGFDVVFLGQAEGLLGAVIDAAMHDVSLRDLPGIATREDPIGRMGPRVAFTPEAGVKSLTAKVTAVLRDADIRRVTLPDFSLLDLSAYDRSSDGLFPAGVEGPAMWYQTSVGCPRECSFCASAGNPYLFLEVGRVEEMLQHYASCGIKTLLSAEDNFLARLLKQPDAGERDIITIMSLIKEYGFSHEFTDGLEVGLLMDKSGRLRLRLIEALFGTQKQGDRLVGTHRLYWPVETFIDRASFSKLAVKSAHYEILEAVLDQGIPQIGFGTILFRDTDADRLRRMEDEMEEFVEWMRQHQGGTEWRLAVFHELPLVGSRNYGRLRDSVAFAIEDDSELWALPINPLNGTHYPYDALFEIKRAQMLAFDPEALAEWDRSGQYSLSEK
jgi:hypothetical protein